MRNIFTLYKKELHLFFSSWIGYFVTAIFLILTGYFFYDIFGTYSKISSDIMMSRQPMQTFTLNVNEHLIRFIFSNMAVILLFVIPLITMRIFSEEKKTGTIEMLMTSPIKNYQLVVGKYLSALTVLVVMLVLTITFILFIHMYRGESAEIEIGPVITGYIGLFFLGGSYLAIGIFISSLTENQIISAIGTFAVLLVLWIIGWSSVYSTTGFAEILRQLSLNNHYENFSKGVVTLADSVYYLCFIVYFLLLTGLSLETARWRGTK